MSLPVLFIKDLKKQCLAGAEPAQNAARGGMEKKLNFYLAWGEPIPDTGSGGFK